MTPEGRFAARTREIRQARAWSQPKLAEEIRAADGPHLDPSNVARLERGTRGIGLNEAYAIATALGSTVASMTGEDPHPAHAAQLEEIRAAEAILAAAEDAVLTAQQRLNRARGSRRGTVHGTPLTDDEARQAADDAAMTRREV